MRFRGNVNLFNMESRENNTLFLSVATIYYYRVLSPFDKAELRVLNFEWQQIDYKGGCGHLIEVAS